MCSRLSLKSELDQLRLEFGLHQLTEDYHPRFNIAPSQLQLALANRKGELHAAQLKWGLVPSWAKDTSNATKCINAKAETLEDKPSFKEAFRKRRCLIIADGFFEWKHEGKLKLPYYIHRSDSRPFTFAGFWETWSRGEKQLHTCTLITTQPNELMEQIHNRMPVILSKEDRERWLDLASPAEVLKSLLQPYEADDLEAYRVSPFVGNSRNEGPECIAPLQ